jgi:hypothetical protein
MSCGTAASAKNGPSAKQGPESGRYAHLIDDGIFDVLGAALGPDRIRTKPACSRCRISRSVVMRTVRADITMLKERLDQLEATWLR